MTHQEVERLGGMRRYYHGNIPPRYELGFFNHLLCCEICFDEYFNQAQLAPVFPSATPRAETDRDLEWADGNGVENNPPFRAVHWWEKVLMLLTRYQP